VATDFMGQSLELVAAAAAAAAEINWQGVANCIYACSLL